MLPNQSRVFSPRHHLTPGWSSCAKHDPSVRVLELRPARPILSGQVPDTTTGIVQAVGGVIRVSNSNS